VVQEYESNLLAEDSDDEKKIFKAEARAERKVKATKKTEIKKYLQRVHPYQRQNGETSKPTRPGRCFNCGERGHWKRDCPKEIKPQNKISIFNYNHSNANDIVSNELINLNQNKLNVPLSPVGSLKAHINEWKNIVAHDYIISIIENGYKLPLEQITENTFLDNNKSAKDNMTCFKRNRTFITKRLYFYSRIQATCCRSFNSSL
jgi:hypothetical protein